MEAPNGGLKNHECRQLLERLQEQGRLRLPTVRHLGGRGPRRVDAEPSQRSTGGDPGLGGRMRADRIDSGRSSQAESRALARVDGTLSLSGISRAVGRQLALLGTIHRVEIWRVCNGRVQPGKWHRAIDWIGWNDEQRKCNLPYIVNHSRFLILPWVRVGWPARSWHTVRADCRETGSDSMDTVPCCWRPWWMANVCAVLATVLRTGFRWDKPKGAVGWIVTMNYTAKLRTDLCLSGLLRCEAAALLSLCLPHPYNVPDRLTMVNKYPWIRDGEHLVFVEARMVQARIARRATKGQRLTVK